MSRVQPRDSLFLPSLNQHRPAVTQLWANRARNGSNSHTQSQLYLRNGSTAYCHKNTIRIQLYPDSINMIYIINTMSYIFIAYI